MTSEQHILDQIRKTNTYLQEIVMLLRSLDKKISDQIKPDGEQNGE